MKRNYEIDMCSGPLVPKVLQFAVPLMLSGILQLLFNAADIIVVGQFTGPRAMAAVGSTSSLNNLIVNIFLGLSIGSSVLMARYYGAKDQKNIDELIRTSILLSITCGFILVVIGLIGARPLLSLMGTPDDVLDQAVLYMSIVFLGMPAMLTYDFGAGILRAVGDTRRPLVYLFTSGIINVCLNLFFVLGFGLGVAGVAIATIISQYISAFLVMRCMIKSDGMYHLDIRKLKIYPAKLGLIIRIGLPAGVQGAFFNISNVLIQSSINTFGSIAVAGNTAGVNLEGFIYTAMNSIYQASTSFTSQAGPHLRQSAAFNLHIRSRSCGLRHGKNESDLPHIFLRWSHGYSLRLDKRTGLLVAADSCDTHGCMSFQDHMDHDCIQTLPDSVHTVSVLSDHVDNNIHRPCYLLYCPLQEIQEERIRHI